MENTNLKIGLISTHLPEKFILKQAKRRSIFMLFLWITIFSSTTLSILISNQQSIIEYYKITLTSFGLLGSIYFLGEFVGTIIILLTINNQNRKRLISFSLFIGALSLIIFYISTNIYLIMGSLFLSGCGIVIINIYIPVWIDQFGINKRKTLNLALINFGKIFGFEIGYVLNYFIKNKFKEEFLCESLILMFLSIILLCKSNLYFSSKVILIDDLNNIEKFSYKNDDDTIEISSNRDSSNISMFKIRSSNDSTKNISFFKKIIKIFSGIYFCTLFSASVIYFCQTAFLFWSVDFVNNNFTYNDFYKNKNNNNNFIKNYFNLIAILFITLIGQIGSLFSNYILSLIFGNYNHKCIPFILLIFYSMACLCGNLIPILSNLDKFYLLLLVIIYLILTSSTLPLLQGILINSVRLSLKGFSYAIYVLFLKIFGEIPSIYIYGLLKDKYKKENENFALNLIMKYNIFGWLMSFLIFGFKCFGNNQNEDEPFSENINKEKELKDVDVSSEKLDSGKEDSKN